MKEVTALISKEGLHFEIQGSKQVLLDVEIDMEFSHIFSKILLTALSL